ncbi:uncharacterized protein LOC141601436 [Silene latifolia]|uniref:uncharacterized protein LOC141601436 n=1 Tax=Silene latifolia TaxID=37657 RepID=UPI003D77BF88
MLCISTPTYTLNLNGAHFGYFMCRRGLRQGDPISPLIFCICMEYLSRLMEFATRKCKGDVQSIMLILRVLATFSAPSGLKVNASKSEVVFNEVSDALKQDITQVSGLTRSDCNILLEKIVSKVRGIGAKKPSYAELKAFLGITYGVGGLNITGHLWLLGIISVVVKKKVDWGADWATYHPPPDSSWNFRNICRVKECLASGFQGNSRIASAGDYFIRAGYHWLQGGHPPVQWYHDLWDSWILPKHAFVGWLIHR